MNKKVNKQSNFHKGKHFELFVKQYFKRKEPTWNLCNQKIMTGFYSDREREFDLVDKEKKILIECKYMTFTANGNNPSAKISNFLTDIFKLYIAPKEYRKIICINKSMSKSKNITLCQHIRKNYSDFLPKNIEIIELTQNSI
ncbi:MAG: hypothetical protein LBJ97_02985 [Mycoplasmataceae bacterium]|jgi:hypothetical protein|nr:hypothetical protein [Mycoplasmataceae bacterium]